MRKVRIGDAAALLGVSPDTVRRLADAGAFPVRRTAGGQRLIDGRDLARYLERGGSGAPKRVPSQSARNRLPGIVTRVVRDRVMAHVEIRVGPHRLVSLMTREAADDLGLAPGVLAAATVKATNVVVEVPPAARPRGRGR